ncbi:hypothetical protein Btru_032361 [Bulinus truncatus]|nr:hypothetical protein Btru_032361 [Bulinus truncatus]
MTYFSPRALSASLENRDTIEPSTTCISHQLLNTAAFGDGLQWSTTTQLNEDVDLLVYRLEAAGGGLGYWSTGLGWSESVFNSWRGGDHETTLQANERGAADNTVKSRNSQPAEQYSELSRFCLYIREAGRASGAGKGSKPLDGDELHGAVPWSFVSEVEVRSVVEGEGTSKFGDLLKRHNEIQHSTSFQGRWSNIDLEESDSCALGRLGGIAIQIPSLRWQQHLQAEHGCL